MKVNESFNQTQRNLLAVMELIGMPERWCQGPMAIDADGKRRWILEPGGKYTQLCLKGSVIQTVGVAESQYWPVWDALRAAMPPLPPSDPRSESPVAFNDDLRTTHADVMALILRAMMWAGDHQPASEPVEQPKNSFLPAAYWDFVNHAPIRLHELDRSTTPSDQAAAVVMDTA